MLELSRVVVLSNRGQRNIPEQNEGARITKEFVHFISFVELPAAHWGHNQHINQ
jgi:hypothetical protein